MRRIPFYIVDAFTDTPLEGNPAGVFFDEDGTLTPNEMMRLCREVSLESAFVTPGDETAPFRLRYFTGTASIPFCGHDTVATLTVLASRGDVTPGDVSILTDVGRLVTSVRHDTAGRTYVTLHQNPVQFGATVDRAQAATALGIPVSSLHPDLPVQVVSTGTPMVFVPLTSRDAVNAISARQQADAITDLSQRHDTLGVYTFTLETDGGGNPACWSRGFCPLVDLPEDPVTGSASGALAGYLVQQGLVPAGTQVTNRQGFGGGRGGTAYLSVSARDGHLYPSVRGTATLVATGSFIL